MLGDLRQTFTLEFQDHLGWGQRQDFVWELGYRFTTSQSDGGLALSLNPADLDIHVFSAFVQDEIIFIPDRVFVTVGTKLEHNYYTGFTLMPNVRASYVLSTYQTVWAAISRAVRTPAETDAAIQVDFAGFVGPGGVPSVAGLIGNPRFKNEGLVAFESGYRRTISKNISIDMTAYYNKYDHQQTVEPVAPFLQSTPLPSHLVIPDTYQNLAYGETHGLEVAADWKITDRWTLTPGYTWQRTHLHTRPFSQDEQVVGETEGTSPHVKSQLRSHVSLTPKLAWDLSAYYVGRLESPGVPSYTRLDSGLTWNWSERWSLAVVGQNLLKDHHLEFIDDVGFSSTFIKRSAYAKLTFQY